MSPVFWPFWRRKPRSQLPDEHTTTTANPNIPIGPLDTSAASSTHPPRELELHVRGDTAQAPPPAPPSRFAATTSGSRPAPSLITPERPEHPEHLEHPEHRRPGRRRADPDSRITTPNPFPPSSSPTQTPARDKPANRRLKAPSQQPAYPLASLDRPAEPAAAAVAALSPPQPSVHGQVYKPSLVQSPFRPRTNKATTDPAHRLRRLPAARLWNPTNSTPRLPQPRKRRPSSPPIPALPLKHPALDRSLDIRDPVTTGAGDYPLLTLSEQRRSRYSQSTPVSFQLELGETSDHRISLPRSVRASYEGKRSVHRTSTHLEATAEQQVDDQHAQEASVAYLSAKSKGKQKATMAPESEYARRPYSKDLERGPDVMDHRASNISNGEGIGSALSSSNSSIMGDDVQPDAGEEWGPQHPCFPHLNPHVPLDSVEYATTRIIRVKRDWLVAGDLAPTFSNLYPEILDPAGVSEQEFRRVIEKLNGELIPIFDPFTFRNMLDSVLGLVTGWLWDDFGLTAAKSRLHNLEKWIEKWNQEMEKTMASEEGIIPPKLISLRQTGYMTLDIQIPDPEIAPAPSTIGAGESQTALPMEPAPAITA
ncbi:Golgin subfamily A member 7/ERF4 family protein [Metarhizium robertsii]|uniref:Ras modification protein ERF4 n=2 Tax=Metarhizium robertsii TaxID=568076 RepID=E9F0Z5_METRA|nr:Golgin subfamily A member 7/ERF4 [Metarhizium robertsii ARSEF 23]EFY98805.1 Golgin subfamily A member 7/ERF4 [Metarhizium robertsii ARSEF 23]EXV04037.1 Golgin subfamily A member 7/ERF4 family protein [Metarhizium robertsii]